MASGSNLHTRPPPLARERPPSTRHLLPLQKRKERQREKKAKQHVASHTLHQLTSLDPPPPPPTPPPPPPPCPGGPHCPCFVIFPACPIIPFPGEKQSVLDLKEKGPCLYHVQLSSHQNASALVCRGRARERESAAAGGVGFVPFIRRLSPMEIMGGKGRWVGDCRRHEYISSPLHPAPPLS